MVRALFQPSEQNPPMRTMIAVLVAGLEQVCRAFGTQRRHGENRPEGIGKPARHQHTNLHNTLHELAMSGVVSVDTTGRGTVVALAAAI